MNESQEILVFLTRYPGGIGITAGQLLDRLGKNGDFETFTKPVSQTSYYELSQKTERLLRRGQRIETILNKFGEMFELKAFIYDTVDLMIEESNAYLEDLRIAEYTVLNDLSKSFQRN